jgi:SAM-dependent methyltransferase
MNILSRIKAAWRRAILPFQCPVCGAAFRAFEPISAVYREELVQAGSELSLESFETLNTAAYACPACGTADRNRLSALLLARRLPRRPAPPLRLLDIAPSTCLAQFIKTRFAVDYRSADLSMAGVDDCVDITDMRNYADAAFAAVLCSHVLEHVPDDRRALREIFRILKPGGWGLLAVPIYLPLASVIEETAPLPARERARLFGQSDHVRLYNREGFVARLHEAGFEVSRMGIEHFGARCFRRCGLAPASALYLATRPRTS